METELTTEFFECVCHSDEHTLKFTYDDEYDELYASVYLYQFRNVFQRIWTAIKYVFGYHSKYGHWDCFIMRPQDAGRLRALLDLMDKNGDTPGGNSLPAQ